jgi:hypothetical protein
VERVLTTLSILMGEEFPSMTSENILPLRPEDFAAAQGKELTSDVSSLALDGRGFRERVKSPKLL